MVAMDGKKVTVTYTDEFGIWQHLEMDFRQHLPLRNLRWQSAKGPVRNIPNLGVELKRFITETTERSHMLPETLPYLNLYFVNCDDNETYRQIVKNQIRDWLNIAESRRNQEWLIVYVTKQENFRNPARYFNMKGTVFDKIKADFNITKRDRCVQLRLSENETEDYEAWQELISKIKEGILYSFDQYVKQYEEDIRKSDSQRSMIGWNYCTFFILKEGLALTFEIMNIFEDALVQYDELEASFFQVLKDRALAWFGSFGATDPNDDSANIIDVKKKQYRDLIMQNTIPEFDFRCYLFARQCQLLGRLHKPVEICRRAQIFISTFSRAIKEHQANVGEYFLESWIFSSCMSVVNECEELAPLTSMDSPNTIAFNAAKGELLDLARKQLDKIGIYYNHLPASLPFTTSLSDTIPTSPNEARKKFDITNKELEEAINSQNDFDVLYLSLTNRALRAYEGSARLRSVLRLQGDVAALHFHRKQYEDAVQVMEDIPWRYGEQGWTVVENNLLFKFAACQKELGQNRSYVGSCLSLLKNYSLLTNEEIAFYADEVKKLCGVLEKGEEINRQFKPIFAISVSSIVDDIGDEDGPNLSVELTNNLSTSFTFDQLAIRLVSGQSEEIWFGVCKEEIKPGLNSYKLYSDNSASGNYFVENVRMSIGKVTFTHNFLNESKKKSFRINEHPSVLRAQIIPPCEIHIGESQYFLVRIFTGLSHVDEGILALEATSDGLSFPKSDKYHSITKTVIDEKISEEKVSEQDLEVFEDGKIRIPSSQSNQLIEFQVPYDCNWGAIEHKVKISVEYKSKGKLRVFTSVDTINVWLPISVNELNIFRDDCLFLKMDITLQGTVPVRILKTDLVPSKVYDVADNPSLTLPSLNLFGKQHASYVYKLTRSKDYHGEEKSAGTQIHFVVVYRSLQDEIEKYVEHTLNTILKSRNLFQHSQFLIENAKEHLLKSVDYVSYGMTDVLDLGELDIAQCESLFTTHGAAKEALVDVVKEFWKTSNQISEEEIMLISNDLKSSISFPVNVPSSKVLNTVELIISKSHDFIVGEPCHCRLIVRHSSYWNHVSTDAKDTFEFFYDVHVDFDNWLLAGHKKLCFTSKVGETKEFPITLVPLKTGHLLVPFVRVASLNSHIFSETVYLNNAEQILVRPRTQSATFFIEQQHRIHSIHSGAGFGGPGHHHNEGMENVEF
ncbi:hypothetical protein RhiirA1_436013 [Rhizophagus irregularis]|uniref:Trafficking protein particle complex subunit 10 n=1 Tax=Rhizophagus irregularis TaxID=588596 RepID=A0A2N0SJW1_9GLOM|nr:hypothetical protein RhiirA1_436013 [Rhizophagus irregularis]